MSGVDSDDLRAQRHADVAADRDAEARRFEHPPGQRRRRRFALGAGDGDHPALQASAIRELDFRDHRHATIARCLDRGLFGRHARTQHDEIGFRERRQLMAADLRA